MYCFFFLNDRATTEIYPFSLHDALPIYAEQGGVDHAPRWAEPSRRRAAQLGEPLLGAKHFVRRAPWAAEPETPRSEEHTSELQSHLNLVCRLLLEKKQTAPSPLHYTLHP